MDPLNPIIDERGGQSRSTRRNALKLGLISSVASLPLGNAVAAPLGLSSIQTEPDSPNESPAPFPFHGLLENEGRSYSNWGQSHATKPAVYVEPVSYEDVQEVARNASRFPSPVSPVGSMLSVSKTMINDGGTLLCTKRLDEIIGLEIDSSGRQIVRVQAGCRLKKLHLWLQARGLEIPFQAEIGEATVGSVAVGDTKDSSIDAAGFFSVNVTSLVFVDQNGERFSLSEANDPIKFYEFKCSYGLKGIVVECGIAVRQATLTESRFHVVTSRTPQEFAETILKLRSGADAFFANVLLDKLYAIGDQRFKLGPGASTPSSSQPLFDRVRLDKRVKIQHGGIPRSNTEELRLPFEKLIYSRADFVNEYWRPTDTENRLDFQFYEHDLTNFGMVLEQSYEFTKSFEDKHGFVPNLWALYFVKRPESKVKPYGLYSSGPGISFSFDPIYSNPNDPKWQLFAQSYNRLAIKKLNARPSPIQTQWLVPGDLVIPKQLSHPRFTTPYYAQFLG
jgi:hypothetical protein